MDTTYLDNRQSYFEYNITTDLSPGAVAAIFENAGQQYHYFTIQKDCFEMMAPHLEQR